MSLANHYSRFRVSERILLTGHSHQAWPDVAFEAQQQAWLDAAALVDDKWGKAAAVADDVRAGWRRLLNDPDGDIALGPNTHELVVRWLSAILPLFGPAEAEPDVVRTSSAVTTDGEFHTIRRQLDRLAEEGVRVEKVAARPVATLAERLAGSIGPETGGVLVSSVLFETAEIVDGLDLIAAACAQHDVPLLVDAYHHLNVVPFDIRGLGLDRAFIVGGGYKYLPDGRRQLLSAAAAGLRSPAGRHRLVQRICRPRRRGARERRALRERCRSLRGSDLRSDVALPGGQGLRLPRRNGADARSVA